MLCYGASGGPSAVARPTVCNRRCVVAERKLRAEAAARLCTADEFFASADFVAGESFKFDLVLYDKDRIPILQPATLAFSATLKLGWG